MAIGICLCLFLKPLTLNIMALSCRALSAVAIHSTERTTVEDPDQDRGNEKLGDSNKDVDSHTVAHNSSFVNSDDQIPTHTNCIVLL